MSDPTDLSAVEALLKERDALRGWLDRVDRSDASVPDAVRARVRQDYKARLDGTIDQLRQHADIVADQLHQDQAEHDLLRDKARAVREALAEAELRHAVGEYDAARFDVERARYVSDLESYEVALDAVAARINGLEDVHLAVMRDPAGTVPIAPGQPAFVQAPSAETVEPIEAFVMEEVTIEELAPRVELSETDDLLSIFDQAESGEATQELGHRTDRIEPPPSTRAPGFGPLSFTPKGGVGVPEGSGPVRPMVPHLTPPIGMPGLDQSPRFVRPAPERGSELVELPPERGERFRVVPDPDPILPDVAAAEAPEANSRTLRCGECGAMNRPLEWYCEKCGAELTAV